MVKGRAALILKHIEPDSIKRGVWVEMSVTHIALRLIRIYVLDNSILVWRDGISEIKSIVLLSSDVATKSNAGHYIIAANGMPWSCVW